MQILHVYLQWYVLMNFNSVKQWKNKEDVIENQRIADQIAAQQQEQEQRRVPPPPRPTRQQQQTRQQPRQQPRQQRAQGSQRQQTPPPQQQQQPPKLFRDTTAPENTYVLDEQRNKYFLVARPGLNLVVRDGEQYFKNGDELTLVEQPDPTQLIQLQVQRGQPPQQQQQQQQQEQEQE
eukprot:UN00940